MNAKIPAPRNRTMDLTEDEILQYRAKLIRLNSRTVPNDLYSKTICQNLEDVIPHLPDSFVDLAIADPPYNLDKTFRDLHFSSRPHDEYESWLESWLVPLKRILKPTASVYVCGDWRSSSSIQRVAEQHFHVQNRITWEREKGRGALSNWKNASEDIWFLTNSAKYTFNVEAVKLKRKVIAPYRTNDGNPKDWEETVDGNYRQTFPSNLWTDLTVPFWSMPENTEHPTQKPEKLIAKLILASSKPGDVVFDPFLGSGTTSVVAKKLLRNYVGVERDEKYCCLAEKRLALADRDPSIQGYREGVFWERNSLLEQPSKKRPESHANYHSLFGEEIVS